MDAILKGLVKSLGSSEPDIRNKGVSYLSVQIPLTDPAAMTELDFAKLWKGLFFCMWHSDGPFVQDALAEQLGSFVLLWRTQDASWAFVRAFFEEMRDSWNRIDDLRADKFRRLVKHILRASAKLCAESGWNKDTFSAYCRVLRETVFSVSTVREFPVGLSVYVCQVMLRTLEEAAENIAPVEGGKKTRKAASATLSFDEFDAEEAVKDEPILDKNVPRLKTALPAAKRPPGSPELSAPATVSEGLCLALSGYLARGGSRSLVAAIRERIINGLCEKALYPALPRDMNRFIDVLYETAAEEDVKGTDGEMRLLAIAAGVIEWRKRDWKPQELKIKTVAEMRESIRKRFDPELIAQRNKEQAKKRKKLVRAGLLKKKPSQKRRKALALRKKRQV